nr:hypothetical protein [Tanacetum cinerariifolium]
MPQGIIIESSLSEEGSYQETLSSSQIVVKLVEAQFTLQLIIMTLSGLEEVKHFKLRKLNHQMLIDLRLPPRASDSHDLSSLSLDTLPIFRGRFDKDKVFLSRIGRVFSELINS